MENQLQKKYGLLTAISMVVGIVIGSGVFFKATKVLANNGGSMSRSILTVLIVGLVMLICSYVFATLATRYEKVNGVVDYAEAALGPKYGYYMGWFLTLIYYPTLTTCLAWISAQYTCTLFGLEPTSGYHVAIGAFFLMTDYALNALAPKLGGKFQVSATIIKLVPLCLMAIVGTIAGLVNGMTTEAMSAAAVAGEAGGGMMGAIVAFAFAYEGWIIATAINAELKDSKKNLPLALILGAVVVIVVYALYFVGLTGALSVTDILGAGGDLPRVAFSALFGNAAGTIVYVFIVISCLGTMNGLMMGCIRGAYSIAVRGKGIAPKTFAQVDPQTNMPTNATVVGLLTCGFWYFYWQVNFIGGYGPFFFTWEPDELPIITLYAGYIPIFISLMRTGKDLNTFKRIIMPALGVVSCCFMVYCAFSSYGVQAWYYLGFFAVVMLVGAIFDRK